MTIIAPLVFLWTGVQPAGQRDGGSGAILSSPDGTGGRRLILGFRAPPYFPSAHFSKLQDFADRSADYGKTIWPLIQISDPKGRECQKNRLFELSFGRPWF